MAETSAVQVARRLAQRLATDAGHRDVLAADLFVAHLLGDTAIARGSAALDLDIEALRQAAAACSPSTSDVADARRIVGFSLAVTTLKSSPGFITSVDVMASLFGELGEVLDRSAMSLARDHRVDVDVLLEEAREFESAEIAATDPSPVSDDLKRLRELMAELRVLVNALRDEPRASEVYHALASELRKMATWFVRVTVDGANDPVRQQVETLGLLIRLEARIEQGRKDLRALQ